MPKSLKICSFIIVTLICFVFYAMHLIENQLVEKLPMMLTQNTALPISSGPVQKGKCWINACVIIPDVVIHPTRGADIPVGTVSVSIPPLWPLRFNLSTPPTSPFELDLTLGAKHWDIHRLAGHIDTFHFDLSGLVKTTQETGELTLKTTGLKTFLIKTFELPPALAWFFTDTESTLSLTPKQGYLRFQGLPLIPLK